jgi:hypothetical protein
MDDETPTTPEEPAAATGQQSAVAPPSFPLSPDQMPPKVSRTWKTWQLVVIALVALLIGVGIGSATKSTKKAAASPPVSVSATEVSTTTLDTTPLTEAPTTTVPAPTVKDFALKLRVVDNSCFDTAGANVTVEPSITYTGPDLSGHAWELTYELHGGSSVAVHTIDGTGSQYSTERQTVTTPTCHDVVTATPTDVVVR